MSDVANIDYSPPDEPTHLEYDTDKVEAAEPDFDAPETNAKVKR